MDTSGVRTEVSGTAGRFPATEWARLIRSWLGNRLVLVGLAVAVIGGGAALNWGWLVAIGVAPIVLSMAPCAVMCAVGLCAMKRKGKAACGGDAATGEAASDRDAPRSASKHGRGTA